MSKPIGTDEMLDRIEELEAKLAKEIEISNNRGNHIEFVLLPQMADLDAKLSKAVEALALADAALSGANMNMRVVEQKVKATLAELKGQ